MKLKSHQEGDVTILSISGKIMGGPDYEKFHAEMKEHIAEGRKKILLDFSHVPWINSTGLGILISGYASLKQAEGRMMVCNVNERVLSLFYTAQIHDLFETHTSTEEALKSFE